MMYRVFSVIILVLTLAVPAFASAPEFPMAVKPPLEAPKPAKKSGPTCPVRGRLYCSEYGTRYKDPVMVVFVSGEDSFGAPVSERDGSFEAALPCGQEYTLRVEFMGKGFDVGKLSVPPKSEGGFRKYIQLFHPGSELELVWEIRDSGETGSVDMKLVDPPEEGSPPAEHP